MTNWKEEFKKQQQKQVLYNQTINNDMSKCRRLLAKLEYPIIDNHSLKYAIESHNDERAKALLNAIFIDDDFPILSAGSAMKKFDKKLSYSSYPPYWSIPREIYRSIPLDI